MTLEDAALRRLAELVERHCGLRHHGGARLAALAHVAAARAAGRGGGLAAYHDRLAEDPAELAALVEELAVGETHFFRNPPQMLALRRRVLPELVGRAAAEGRPVTAWSAGCSTGEEAYSLAMLLAEAAEAASVPVRVTGTDLSERALSAARAGVYLDRSLLLAGDADRQRWFDAAGGGWRVSDELRALVRFGRHNLVTDPSPFPAGSVDLLLCRNVMIYFSRETVRALVARLHAVLAPGGYLLLGHAETLWQVSDAFTLVQVGDGFLYRRDVAGPPPVPRGRGGPVAAARTGPVAHPPGAGPEQVGPERVGPEQVGPEQVGPEQVGPGAAEALVRAELAAGRYRAAVRAATEMLRGSADASQAARAHYLCGLALVSAHRDGEALTALDAARRLDPGDGLAQFLRATVLDRLGRRAEAAAGYAAAAVALAGRPPGPHAPELDGRSPADLAELCRRMSASAAAAAVG